MRETPREKIASGANFLADFFLESAGEGKLHIARELVVLFAESEKHPAVFENIEDSTEIPQRGDDESDIAGCDALHLVKKCLRIVDMLNGVGAEGVLELVRGEGQVADVIYDDKVRNVGVVYDIDIHAAAVGFSAADVEIPFLSAAPDDPAHDSVAEKIKRW